ncbi:hypothetical protein Misp05_40340 [Micromonospora sp. NBRC 107095]|nr:hypothetical protein Misp05_40340 [Micromonospora sp. NBRC 107095]
MPHGSSVYAWVGFLRAGEPPLRSGCDAGTGELMDDWLSLVHRLCHRPPEITFGSRLPSGRGSARARLIDVPQWHWRVGNLKARQASGS